jgi:phage tail-like protein
MPPIYREDPYGGYNFEVTVTGVSDDGKAVKGAFKEVSGLESEVTPIEYRTGVEDIINRQLPGLKKVAKVVLKRGITGDLAFWNWILKAMDGEVFRTEMSITLHDENRDEVMRWNMVRAWPCKWTGPGMNAGNSEVAMETVEICHEGLSIDGQS